MTSAISSFNLLEKHFWFVIGSSAHSTCQTAQSTWKSLSCRASFCRQIRLPFLVGKRTTFPRWWARPTTWHWWWEISRSSVLSRCVACASEHLDRLVQHLLTTFYYILRTFQSSWYLTKRLSWRAVHDDIDPENLHGVEWIWNSHQLRERYQWKRCDWCAQLEPDEISDVIKDSFAFFNSRAENFMRILLDNGSSC